MRGAHKYRYALYGFLVGAGFCGLLFLLHYLISSGTPGQLLREFPAAVVLAFLSLPLCLLAGYLLGAEKDQRASAVLWEEKYREQEKKLEGHAALLARNQVSRHMARIAAQEMKHPLTSIVGYVMTLREYWDRLDDEAKREFLEFIKVSSSRLEGITNDLMRIMELGAHHQRPHDEKVEVAEIVSEVCALMEEVFAQRGLKVALRFLDRIPPMWSDSSLLFDLLYNLVDICMRSSEDGGMVSVWCSRRDSRLTMHLRCHKSSLNRRTLERLGEWPPEESEGEAATLGMEYHLAMTMAEELGGELKMDMVGESGVSFMLSLGGLEACTAKS
ncbi:MAG: HAMP domain-containing histidine kinase [Actinobacteria bacterium]|nr:HAMP domain-containing histidine kinase [Actinomycetota bacterium]